jgi:cellulose synthase/poly-beta-1,6-N-acetylglucosamine synthase-like glycosyltransferase
MTPLETLILATYFFILIILAGYGWHRYYLVYSYMKHRDKVPVPAGRFDELPTVTLQLPIYNEMYVVDRLIQSVCRMDYPRDRFEVQVLDDSTDETRSIAQMAVRRAAAQGVDITYLHRDDRTGYKAGALEAGMKVAKGEFIAIFDADFLPTPDFLKRTVDHFTDPKVAVVQARWGHINADYSLLTKIQSILLDAHFVLEHGGRNRAGHFFNFNGTAGIWRRAAIEDGGGWQHDTLTEDLDLSYRAQLRGWKFHFLPDLVVPAELPVEMNAFKSQQHRWAKARFQTLRRCAAHPAVEPAARREGRGVSALTANFNYVLMVLLSILMFPSMVIRYNMGCMRCCSSTCRCSSRRRPRLANFYIVCQREVYPDEWIARLKFTCRSDVDRHRPGDHNARAPCVEAMAGNRPSSRARRNYASRTAPTSGSASATGRRTSSSRSSSCRWASTSPSRCFTRCRTASTARCRS